jgi:hypothetical protein
VSFAGQGLATSIAQRPDDNDCPKRHQAERARYRFVVADRQARVRRLAEVAPWLTAAAGADMLADCGLNETMRSDQGGQLHLA